MNDTPSSSTSVYGVTMDPPCAGTAITLPMANCQLLTLADTIMTLSLRKRRTGADPYDEYNEQLVTKLFSRDGVFNTVVKESADFDDEGTYDGWKHDATATICDRYLSLEF